MAKSSHEDWVALIKQQPASGLRLRLFAVSISSVSAAFMPVNPTRLKQ